MSSKEYVIKEILKCTDKYSIYKLRICSLQTLKETLKYLKYKNKYCVQCNELILEYNTDRILCHDCILENEKKDKYWVIK